MKDKWIIILFFVVVASTIGIPAVIQHYKMRKEVEEYFHESFTGVISLKTIGGCRLGSGGIWVSTIKHCIDLEIYHTVEEGDSIYKYPDQFRIDIFRKDSTGLYRIIGHYDEQSSENK